MRGRWTAWRAALRIARRDVWRNKARAALVALMVALPVLAASTVGVLLRSSDEEPRDTFVVQAGPVAQAIVTSELGSAPISQAYDLSSYSTTGEEGETSGTFTVAEFQRRVAAVLPGDRLYLQSQRWSQGVTAGDRTFRTSLLEFDYAAMGSAGPFEQLEGHAPLADDQVVVTRSLVRTQRLSVGERLSLPRAGEGARVVTVVGVVGGLPTVGRPAVIARPGAVFAAQDFRPDADHGLQVDLTWFVSGPEPVTWQQVRQINAFGGGVLSRAVVDDPPTVARHEPFSTDATVIGIFGVVIGLVLLQVALMAGPAIAVGARRNERALAIVAAAGGQPRHLRAVVLSGSALIGLVASLAAAVLGVGLAAALVPVLRTWLEQPIVRVDVRPLDQLGLVAVGTVTATLAALLPARRVGRIDVAAAIAGRRPTNAPKLRVPVLGIAVTAGGFGLAWAAAVAGLQFPATLGLGLAEVGLVIASPAIVGLAARAVNRSSFVARFAFRDAARQRSRTAPALAAVLAAIAGGMTAIAFAHSEDAVSRATYTSNVPVGSAYVQLGGGDDAELDARVGQVRAAAERAFPVAATAVLNAPSSGDVSVWSGCAPSSDSTCSETGFAPEIVDPSAAAVLVPDHADEVRAALAAGKLVAFDARYVHGGQAQVGIATEEEDGYAHRRPMPAVLVHAKDPLISALMPAALAERLGLGVRPDGVAITGRQPIDVAQEGRLLYEVDGLGSGSYAVVERGFESESAWIYLALVAAAALVALIGTFTAVGLAAAESRPDLGTLASVGAAPATRRRIGAAQAAAIAVPGALLGLVSGTLAAWVLVRLNATSNANWQDPDLWRLRVPWDQVAALGLGIPLLAVVLGFVTVRSRLVPVRRLGE